MNGKRTLELFAGAGGGILGGLLIGQRCVCAVEWIQYRQDVLRARQRGGFLPEFPIFGDVRQFDGTKWRGRVDIISGGFPCQPFSAAGKRRGEDDSRNMWPDTIRVIREVRPGIVFLENVPALLAHWYFGRILGDLAESGYDAVWDCISASSVGAPHQRDRLWILATRRGVPDPFRREVRELGEWNGEQRGEPGEAKPGDDVEEMAHPEEGRRRNIEDTSEGKSDSPRGGNWYPGVRRSASEEKRVPNPHRFDADDPGSGASPDGGERRAPQALRRELPDTEEKRRYGRGIQGSGETSGASRSRPEGSHPRWPAEPDLGRVAHGVADRVERIEALGDGQVPFVYAMAFRKLCQVSGVDTLRWEVV